MNCACGSTAYQGRKRGYVWCRSSNCRKGNSKLKGSGALNKCPRCDGYAK